MKNNSDLYSLSIEGFLKAQEKKEVSESIETKQNNLLKVLFDRFKKEIETSPKKNGLLRVKMMGGFFSIPDDGFKEIEELMKSGNFEDFAREYCIYLGEVQPLEDNYHRPYIELVWDYKTYFEQQFMRDINISDSLPSNKGMLMHAIRDFKALPMGHQLVVVKQFRRSVNAQTEEYRKEVACATCGEEGHDFGEWIRVERREAVDPKELEDDRFWERKWNPYWQRRCTRCGFIERQDHDPQIDEGYKERIKSLEEELAKKHGE